MEDTTPIANPGRVTREKTTTTTPNELRRIFENPFSHSTKHSPSTVK
jgi:hypothetical protein